MSMSKEVILTGLRANAEFHIGNYLGAILPMVRMQKSKTENQQLNMFVPDLHSFTTPIDHSKLQQQIIDNLKIYAAAGINLEDENTFIYRQSYIAAHSELTVILNNFAYFGELSRMTQFKEKSDAQKDDSVSVGLFDYPVLMASDILLYDSLWVPVGEDQQQHLELTRDLAIRLNNKFDELFTIPHEWKKQLEFAQLERGVRIRSLKHPEKKMSKSVDDPAGTIMLSDKPDDAAKKIMSATTDSGSSIDFNMKQRPGISNLIQILALVSGTPEHEVIEQWKGKSSYGELKNAVAESVKNFLKDFQNNLANVDEQKIHEALQRSEAAMNEVAVAKLSKVQKAVGLR